MSASSDERARIIATFGQLEAQPGLVELVTELAADGWRILALTNSSVDSTRRLLEQAGIVQHFAALLSCDQIQKFKPIQMCMRWPVARPRGRSGWSPPHAWDIQGAVRAGFRTIFISALERGYLDVHPKPDVIVAQLSEVGSALRSVAAVR